VYVRFVAGPGLGRLHQLSPCRPRGASPRSPTRAPCLPPGGAPRPVRVPAT